VSRAGCRAAAALAQLGLVLAAYFLWARPYQLRWGATGEETARPMPGDNLDPRPAFLATRAILEGVKSRVEGRTEPMVRANFEFAVYLPAALVFFVALLLGLVRPLTSRRWWSGLAAGATWLFAWYSPAPTWLGALLALLVAWRLVTLPSGCARSFAPPHTRST
jgi:hypothetical protein